jgi:hypothetical protein
MLGFWLVEVHVLQLVVLGCDSWLVHGLARLAWRQISSMRSGGWVGGWVVAGSPVMIASGIWPVRQMMIQRCKYSRHQSYFCLDS